MLHLMLTILILLFPASAVGQGRHGASPHGFSPCKELRPAATLIADLGNHHHPVSTKHREAQRFFNQGLTLVYAFNHEEAIRSFRRAAELDPGLAMAYWGIALASGPNINLDIDPTCERVAYEAVQKAAQLAKAAGTSGRDRAYINALATRYSGDAQPDVTKLAVDYKIAMGELVKRYLNDLDAATLYAESMMDLRPWKLWDADGRPATGTEEVIAVLESVLRRDPRHIGANHYYIHALEASPRPERALASANLLSTLAPAAGHLLHMPSHIYMRVGDYAAAAKSNEGATEIDRQLYVKTCEPDSVGCEPLYVGHYYSHNLLFLTESYAMQGRSKDAMRVAGLTVANASRYVKDQPELEHFLSASTLVLAGFRRWDDILGMPQPDHSLLVTKAVSRWARAMAYASAGKMEEAEKEQQAFMSANEAVPCEAPWGNGKARSILRIAESM